MGRKKLITTNELIKNLDEYIVEHNGAVPTIPQLGEYIRKKGMPVKDYLLRRDNEFEEYLKNVKEKADIESDNDVVVYSGLNVYSFLEKNNTRQKLVEALTARDKYYGDIASKASRAIKEKEKLKKKVHKLDEEVKFMEDMLDEANAKLEEKFDTTEVTKLRKTLAKMKQIMNKCLYPDMANALLKKDGLLETVNELVPDELADKIIIDAKTDISSLDDESDNSEEKPAKKSKKKAKKETESTGVESVDKMFGGFDE